MLNFAFIKRPKSLKHFLFLSIASSVVILAILQLLFFGYIKNALTLEIQDRSEAISGVALQAFTERVVIHSPDNESNVAPNIDIKVGDLEPTVADRIEVTITETPGVEFPLGDGYSYKTGDKTKTATIRRVSQSQRNSSNNTLLAASHGNTVVIPSIKVSRLGDAYQFDFGNHPNSHLSHHIVQFENNTSVLDRYFDWLVLGTIIVTLGILFYVFWLSGRISQPLNNLASGFKELEQGNYGSEVEVKGVDEVKQTLQQFNHMSQTLARLQAMENQLQQQKQLGELNEVTRGLAHTLRNPINSIGLAIEQISQSGISQESREQLALQVRQKISRLDKTIKAMLSLTTHDISRDKQVDINIVVQDVLLEFSMNTKVVIHFTPVPGISVKGAESEVRSIIHTLVTNAVEASNDGGEIYVTVSKLNEVIEIRVVDQGKGMSESIKVNLFKPHISDKAEGAGMGLFIANRICESHYQGRISFKDNQPKGTVAIIQLKAESH